MMEKFPPKNQIFHFEFQQNLQQWISNASSAVCQVIPTPVAENEEKEKESK